APRRALAAARARRSRRRPRDGGAVPGGRRSPRSRGRVVVHGRGRRGRPARAGKPLLARPPRRAGAPPTAVTLLVRQPLGVRVGRAARDGLPLEVLGVVHLLAAHGDGTVLVVADVRGAELRGGRLLVGAVVLLAAERVVLGLP